MDVAAFERAHPDVEDALATLRTADGRRFTGAVWKLRGTWTLNTQLTHSDIDPGPGVGEVIERLLPIPLPWTPPDLGEVLDHCEGCRTELRAGDKAHSYDDGPRLCEPCAPTFASLMVEYEADAAPGDLNEIFGSSEAAAKALALVKAKVAAGEGHLKHVWPI